MSKSPSSGSGSVRHSEARRARGPTPSRPGIGGPVLRFIALFALATGVLYAGTLTPFFETNVWGPYLEINAVASGAVLDALGQAVTVNGRIVENRFASLRIDRGCDAIYPSALYIGAVLAFPVPFRRKWGGLIIGTAALMLLNLVRIVSLFYVRLYWPAAFDVAHVEIWQAVFIALAVLFWMIWAWRATSIRTHESA